VHTELEKIWQALINLDKADIQSTALCHAIITLMIEKGIVTQEQAAEELEKSIPKVLSIRKGVADALSDPRSILDAWVETKTVQ
jgi:hypothetical protein